MMAGTACHESEQLSQKKKNQRPKNISWTGPPGTGRRHRESAAMLRVGFDL